MVGNVDHDDLVRDEQDKHHDGADQETHENFLIVLECLGRVFDRLGNQLHLFLLFRDVHQLDCHGLLELRGSHCGILFLGKLQDGFFRLAAGLRCCRVFLGLGNIGLTNRCIGGWLRAKSRRSTVSHESLRLLYADGVRRFQGPIAEMRPSLIFDAMRAFAFPTSKQHQGAMDQSATLAKIEDYFKQNIKHLIDYLASQFSCQKSAA
jgi:hypothetical protein